MEDIVIPLTVVPILFIGLPWLIFHYITKWKTAATLTSGDEKLLDELHDAARRLDDRLCTLERIIAALFLSSGSILPIYFIAGWVTPAKPRELEVGGEDKQFWQGVRASPARAARDISSRFKDIDRRLADIESYVTTENRSLAREIEALATDKRGNTQ
jgi:phage shock protein B